MANLNTLKCCTVQLHSILERETPKSKTSSGNVFTGIDILQCKINFMKLNSIIIKLKKHSLTQSYHIFRDFLLLPDNVNSLFTF